jgi:hypothetical protein
MKARHFPWGLKTTHWELKTSLMDHAMCMLTLEDKAICFGVCLFSLSLSNTLFFVKHLIELLAL